MSERFAKIPLRTAAARELSARDLRVFIAISAHADADGRAFPSMATIARMTAIGRNDVPRSTGRLERLGLIRRQPRRRPDGSWASTVYFVVFATTDKAASPPIVDVSISADPVSVDLLSGMSVPALTQCQQTRIGNVSTVADLTDIKQTNQQIPTRHASPLGSVEREFEQFWRAYPSRGGHPNPKKPAREKFIGAVRRGINPKLIIAGAANYAAFIARSSTAGKYVKQAEGWLNKECWDQYAHPVEREQLQAGLI